jgi:hypothetical protein
VTEYVSVILTSMGEGRIGLCGGQNGALGSAPCLPHTRYSSFDDKVTSYNRETKKKWKERKVTLKLKTHKQFRCVS